MNTIVYTNHIRFEWDENKNNSNIERHGIDFCDVQLIFAHPMLIKMDNRKDYGEKRWIELGLLYEIVVVIVFTKRKDITRVISIRRANKNEQKIYQETFKK